jgi:hypothetical protein
MDKTPFHGPFSIAYISQQSYLNLKCIILKRKTSSTKLQKNHLNWLKANRKQMNAGKMKAERVEKFRKLLELTEQYKRKNQYE